MFDLIWSLKIGRLSKSMCFEKRMIYINYINCCEKETMTSNGIFVIVPMKLSILK